MKNETSGVPVTFAGIERPARVPGWARTDFGAKSALVRDLTQGSFPLGVSVLRSRDLKSFLQNRAAIEPLLGRLAKDQGKHFRVVLGVGKSKESDAREIALALRNVQEGIASIDLFFDEDGLRNSLKAAITKLLIARFDDESMLLPDPLGEVRKIAESGKSLRAVSGRLDAKRIADVFGMSHAELARQLGLKSRQTLNKTPDSESLQRLLRPYERIARLRTILSDEAFRAWLNTPNEHLEDRDPPMDYLKAGASAQLADFSENMLAGATT